MQRGIVFGAINEKHGQRGFDRDGRFHAVAYRRGVDRHKSCIEPKGIDLAAFRKNPVLVAEHAAWIESGHAPVIGRVHEIDATDDELRFVGEFAPTDMGQERKSLYEGGFMRAFSVGVLFRKTEYKSVGDGEKRETILHVPESELLEISTVAVPSEREALIRAIQSNVGGAAAANALGLSHLAEIIESDDRAWPGARSPEPGTRSQDLAAIERLLNEMRTRFDSRLSDIEDLLLSRPDERQALADLGLCGPDPNRRDSDIAAGREVILRAIRECNAK